MPRPTIPQLARAVHTAVLEVDDRTLREELTSELRGVLRTHDVDCHEEISRDLLLAVARGLARVEVAIADVAADAVRDAQHGALPDEDHPGWDRLASDVLEEAHDET